MGLLDAAQAQLREKRAASRDTAHQKREAALREIEIKFGKEFGVPVVFREREKVRTRKDAPRDAYSRSRLLWLPSDVMADVFVLDGEVETAWASRGSREAGLYLLRPCTSCGTKFIGNVTLYVYFGINEDPSVEERRQKFVAQLADRLGDESTCQACQNAKLNETCLSCGRGWGIGE